MHIPVITPVEIVKWKGKEDLLLEEIRTLWQTLSMIKSALQNQNSREALDIIDTDLENSIEFITNP